MAGQLKEVRNRIKSIQNSQQITKAMKMVSAAKLRRAQDAIIQMRPYAQKLQELLSNIVSSSEGDLGMSLAVERPVEKVLLIVITSDRNIVEVVLNGEKVSRMNFDEWPDANKRPDGSPHKFDIAYKQHPREGYIGLQDHGSPCWFKNIKLRPLP